MKYTISLLTALILLCTLLHAQKYPSEQTLNKIPNISDKLKSCICSNIGGNILLDESFEGDLNGWYYYDGDGNDDSWGIYENGEGFVFSRTGVFGAGSYYNENGNNDWLITPGIEIPENTSEVNFSFWAHSHDSELLESFNVLLSTNGDDVDNFSVTLEEVANVPAEWTQYNYDLSAYAGKTINLAVQHVSVNKWYLMLDDFLVTVSEAQQTDDWTLYYSTLYNTSEAQIVARTGDIDNLGFGWASGFDPFSGASTRSHGFPWTVDENDPAGTDRIMVISSYDGNPPSGTDGYTSRTSRPENNPVEITVTYDLTGTAINSAVFQIFVDDFQAPNWGANYQVSLDNERIFDWEDIVNSLSQSGPIGKLISLSVPSDKLELLTDGEVSIFFDDPITGAGDGFAIDFVRLLINPGSFSYTGTITGVVKNNENSDPIANAYVSAAGIVSTYTNSNGEFVLNEVPAGLVNIEITADGYEKKIVNVDLEGDQTENVLIYLEEEDIVEVPEILSTSYGPPENADEWVKYTIPLVAETFGVNEATFNASMQSIGLIRIRTEMRDGDDKGYVDEVSMGNLYSNFDTGIDGWGVMGDGTLGYESTNGYNGGCISIDDWASGDWHWAAAPDSWTGDLKGYIGQNFEFYFKTTHPSYSAIVEFHTTETKRLVLTANSYLVEEGDEIQATVSLSPDVDEEVNISLSSSNSSVASSTSSLTITSNQASSDFRITTGEVDEDTDVVITATASGFSTARMTLTIKNKETPTTGTIIGRVTDDDTGNPIANATVEYSSEINTTTNGDGYFELSDVPADPTYLVISADGYESKTIAIEVFAGETQNIDVKLEPVQAVEVPDILSTSYGPPENADEWVKYTIPLVAETFDVNEATFNASMKSIGLIRIRTEMRTGDDKGYVDEVSMGNLYSNFDTGIEDWGVMGDGTLGYESSAGYNGGCISIDDWASGDWHWAVAPDSWTGDLSGYIGQNFEFFFKTTHPSYSAVVEFHTSTSKRIILSAEKQSLTPGKTIPVEVTLVPAPSAEINVSLSSSDNVLIVPSDVMVDTDGKAIFNVSSVETVNTTTTSVLTASASGYSSARLTFTVNPKSDNYESTMEGGYWHVAETWIGGEVPPTESNVKINGPVKLYTGNKGAGWDYEKHFPISDLLISENGILQVESTDGDFDSGMYIVSILGDLSINGSIKSGDGIIIIEIAGDVVNNGSLQRAIVKFVGEENQNIQMADNAIFNGVNFYDENTGSPVSVSSNLIFDECGITMVSMQGSETGTGTLNVPTAYNLSLKDCFFANTKLVGNGNIIQSNGECDLYEEISLSNIVLEGDFEVDGTTTFVGDSVVIKGSIYGGSVDTINSNTAHFVNYGEVGRYFTVNLKANVTSSGEWKNRKTFICGVNDQHITFNNYSGFEFKLMANVDGASSYQWKKDGSNLTQETDVSLVLSDLDKGDNGIYKASTNLGHSRNIVISVDVPELIADFEADVTTGSSLEVNFTDLSQGDPEQWKWYIGDPQTESVHSYDQNPVMYFYDKGSYDITLVVKNGSRTDTLTKIGYIVVEEGNGVWQMENKMSVYPNPVNDVLSISLLNRINENGDLSIIDQVGRAHRESQVVKNQSFHAIDVSGLKKGFYVVELRLNDGIYRSRFLKN